MVKLLEMEKLIIKAVEDIAGKAVVCGKVSGNIARDITFKLSEVELLVKLLDMEKSMVTLSEALLVKLSKMEKLLVKLLEIKKEK